MSVLPKEDKHDVHEKIYKEHHHQQTRRLKVHDHKKMYLLIVRKEYNQLSDTIISLSGDCHR